MTTNNSAKRIRKRSRAVIILHSHSGILPPCLSRAVHQRKGIFDILGTIHEYLSCVNSTMFKWMQTHVGKT